MKKEKLKIKPWACLDPLGVIAEITKEIPNKRQDVFICKTCNKEFPEWYWGVSGKMGGFGTIRKPGIARANFNRHVKKCATYLKISKKGEFQNE